MILPKKTRTNLEQFCDFSARDPLCCSRHFLLTGCIRFLYYNTGIMRTETLERCAVQRFTVVRMCDADEQLGAFLE